MSRLKEVVGLSILLAVVLLAVFLFSDAALAHPGNTASDGCHYCRTNCDKWGVAWNQRHCHGGSATPAPASKPTPAPATSTNNSNTVKKDTTIDSRIKEKINAVKNDYSKNHEGFRENLIKDIVVMIGNEASTNRIGYFVYTMLPDIGTEPDYKCDCSKTCPNIRTCEEAQYQLNSCGCTVRDADHDGIACDNECQ